MTLAAWILLASLEVTDAAGHRPAKAIAPEGAVAIAGVCNKVRGSEPGSSAMCASVMIVMCFRESGYNLSAVGDGGKAKGPWQVHSSVAPKTWDEAVKQYLPILQHSAVTCVEPLAMLASGSCTNKAGIAISRARMAEARRVFSVVGGMT